MAIVNRSNSVLARAGHAHLLHKREVPASSAVASPTLVSEGVEASPSPSVAAHHSGPTSKEKAIAASMVIVGILIIGIVIWQIGRWRRRKARAAASSKFNIAFNTNSMSDKPIPLDFDMDGRELEKPSTANILLPMTPAASVKPSLTGKPWTHTIPASGDFPSDKPPSYAAVNGALNQSYRVPPPALEIPQRPKSSAVVVPSPRSSSFGVDSPLFLKAQLTAALKTSRLATANKPLPRAMFVESTFKPSLSDELLVKPGETVRMLEEYEDEWCLVQRGSPEDGQKGVVPRFCLRELP
ncbi:predicted protein [Postia placenta Mad-698-R]|uniref:SH3 domain-containing protein n=1 Tax=Postia placenta MAD-698-R-SB12 TaxID=670580 RepID=A0A1X6MWI2_9APHY|nr:hypothetical protein POSPLADRAFT_1048086 [Postia placenta MAD-698-R-SB12]EED80529.1 predicted protein [Postia placenta Mad-698-R]OSX60709.1 hypothetical protein POSPLADRAFT_1048086 [Postia placenta MAD-698-R-SB12]